MHYDSANIAITSTPNRIERKSNWNLGPMYLSLFILLSLVEQNRTWLQIDNLLLQIMVNFYS